MLNVAIVNAVYPPEPVVSAYIGADLARHLTDTGARVTVLCPFPTRPHGVTYEGLGQHGGVHVSEENGVRVVRLPSFTSSASRLLPRSRESFSFGRHTCRYLEHHLPDVDVVYANTWPLISQSMVARYCVRHGIPMVLHIQDVYPESLLKKLPVLAQRIATVPLTALDRATAHQASRLVVISPNMGRTYVEDRGVPPEKVAVIFDWQDEERFIGLPDRSAVCAAGGVRADQFTFMYLGNIGPVAGVELLIRAFARALIPNSQLLIVGDGAEKEHCKTLVAQLGLGTVHFLTCPTPADAPVMQQMAHVCLLPVRTGAAMSSIPSKLTAYLLSGKPVLATVDRESDTASCIRDAGCGWVGEPENVDGLARQMRAVAGMDQRELDDLGANGRSYALKFFSKAEGVRRLADVIIETSSANPRGGV